MSNVNTYDPAKNLFSFAGHTFTAYAKGTFIKVERSNPTFSMSAGSSGEVAFTKSNDKTGKVTLTLMAQSQDNDFLSTTHIADEALGTGLNELFIKEITGTTAVHASKARIAGPPTLERADEHGSVEWEFLCADVDIFIGGLL